MFIIFVYNSKCARTTLNKVLNDSDIICNLFFEKQKLWKQICLEVSKSGCLSVSQES